MGHVVRQDAMAATEMGDQAKATEMVRQGILAATDIWRRMPRTAAIWRRHELPIAKENPTKKERDGGKRGKWGKAKVGRGNLEWH